MFTSNKKTKKNPRRFCFLSKVGNMGHTFFFCLSIVYWSSRDSLRLIATRHHGTSAEDQRLFMTLLKIIREGNLVDSLRCNLWDAIYEVKADKKTELSGDAARHAAHRQLPSAVFHMNLYHNESFMCAKYSINATGYALMLKATLIFQAPRIFAGSRSIR